MERIDIYKDFSNTPGGRYRREGEYSGEEFRESIFLPAYERCEKYNQKLTINFDHCFGFATSFLEEAFGGLVRNHEKKSVMEHIEIISNDDETIPKLIKKYVSAAESAL